MSFNIRVGGVWKAADSVKIKVGGVWKEADQLSIKVAGVWKDILATGPSVIIAATKLIFKLRFGSTCYARVKVDNDGDLYESNNAGTTYASYETWLDAGLNSEVWVQRTIISGSLNLDAGSGRLACTADRLFGVQRSTTGTATCTIDLKFYDAASGGNLLDTQRVTLTAEYEFL